MSNATSTSGTGDQDFSTGKDYTAAIVASVIVVGLVFMAWLASKQKKS